MRMHRRIRNALIWRSIRYAVFFLIGIYVGYKLKEIEAWDAFVQAIDHKIVVFNTFCIGKIPYSVMTEGHIVVHYRELREIAHSLNEAKKLVQDRRTQMQIDSQLQFLENKILRKHGDKVCPELLSRTTLYDNPLKSFETDVNCDIDKINMIKAKSEPKSDVVLVNALLTFLFDFSEDECSVMAEKVKRMETINKLYPNSWIIFGINSLRHNSCKPETKRNVLIIEGEPKTIWEKMIEQVTTPYTFLGRDLVDFDANADMNRVLREFKRFGVPLVGGAFKTVEDGHWHMNCYQMDRNFFTVNLEHGYHHSYHDCVYCSYFRGPLVAETKFLKSKLNFASQSSDEMFLDLFFGNLNQGLSSAVCPDVMYLTEESKLKSLHQNVWLKMGQRHEFVSATDEFGQTFNLPCDELELPFIKSSKDLLTHPCILEQISKAVSVLMSMCRKRGIICELTAGNLLGAIKYNSTIPWEYDADILFHPDQGALFDASFEKEWQSHGYFLERHKYTGFEEGKQAYFNPVIPYKGQKIKFDLWPILNMDRNKKWPKTKVYLDGEWMEAPDNPGKDVRNYIGPEVYKHTTLRTLCGFGASTWEKELPEADVPFPPCSVKNSHACLDQFLSDGNIQFNSKRRRFNNLTP